MDKKARGKYHALAGYFLREIKSTAILIRIKWKGISASSEKYHYIQDTQSYMKVMPARAPILEHMVMKTCL